MKKTTILSIALLILTNFSLQAAVVGSLSTVSDEPFYTFLSTDTDNEILGFAQFNDGFALEDSTTSCIFNGFFPVSGTVSWNGGTMTLMQDLIFKNISSLPTWGNVYGGGYLIDLCQTITALSPVGTNVLNNTNLTLRADIILTGTLLVQGSCTILGNNQSLIFDTNAAIIVDTGATLEFNNIELNGISDGQIICVDNSSSLYLNNVMWEQNTDVTFSVGSILFNNAVDFVGTASFFYESSQSSTILSNSQWTLNKNMTLAIGNQTLTNSTPPLVFVDNSSVIKFDNASMIVTDSGIQLTVGTLEFVGNGNLDIASTVTTYGMILGDGVTAANDFTIFFDAGSTLNFSAGYLVYNNTTPDKFVTASQDSLVTRYPNSLVYVAQNWTQPSYTLQASGNFIPQLLLAPGVTFALNNTQISFPQVVFSATANQPNADTFALTGNNSLIFTQGNFGLPIIISGIGNSMSGNANITYPIQLTDNSSQVTFALLGSISDNILLNGGTCTLDRDLILADGAILTGSGLINLDSHKIDLPSQDTVWTSTINWNGNASIINLNGDLDLAGTWTISGVCILNGQGNTLDVSSGGQIVIETNSQLKIRNIQITGIGDGSITCIDNTGSLVLDNVTWSQVDNVTFPAGSILFKNTVRMVGEYVTFAYQSGEASTVASASTLYLDENFTFSYDPVAIASQNLLLFTDNTSWLVLDGATLHATQTGMQLMVGEVRVISDSNLAAEQGFDQYGNLIVDQGINFGDCANSNNDMVLYITGNTTLHVIEGNLGWRDILQNSLRMPDLYSTLNIEDNSELFLYQNFYGNGSLNFYNNIVVGQAPGVSFGAQSTSFYGSETFITLSPC
jgi:hypothetical protein